jgi:lipopolysaccharide export LptBFGC system permease protein LptF
MSKYIDMIMKLGVITVLLVAVTTRQNHNYDIFVHWTVFGTSLYFAYKSRSTGIFGVILFCAFAILFNPFIAIGLSNKIWWFIQLLTSILIFLSIDWKSIKEEHTPKQKLIFNLIKGCFWGLTTFLLAIAFLYHFTGNPYHEFLLITQAKTANGLITYSEESKDVAEPEGRSASEVYDVYYEYTFATEEGKTIKSHATDRNSEPGYLKEVNEKPMPIEVEYIPTAPEINRIKGRNYQAQTITEFLWRRVGLGIVLLLMFTSVGFTIARNAIKNFIRQNKKLAERG